MTDPEPQLSDGDRDLIGGARRAVLTTLDVRDGRPRSVPICFVAHGAALYSPLDEKPKAAADVRSLRRVRNLLADPRATILIDRWDEDWTKLGWVRLYGTGEVLEPEPREVEEHAAAVAALRAKYPQYEQQGLDGRPIIRIAIDRVVSWGDTTP